MSRVSNVAEGDTELDQVWGLRSDFYRLFLEDYAASLARVDPILVEICRLRLARLLSSEADLSLRYRPAVEAGLDEEKIAAIPDYYTSPLFSERERICLEFCEQFAIQSSAISDDDVDKLKRHLSDEEMIYFVKTLGVLDQFARVNSAFNLSACSAPPSLMLDFAVAAASRS